MAPLDQLSPKSVVSSCVSFAAPDALCNLPIRSVPEAKAGGSRIPSESQVASRCCAMGGQTALP